MEIRKPHELDIGESRPQGLANFELQASDEPLIEQMSQEHQTILRSEGDYAAIAQRNNLPIGTVKSRLHRAKAALVELRKMASRRSEIPTT